MKHKGFAKGILWNTFAVLFSRIGSVLGQVIAGFYLVAEDFGLFAAVIAVTAIIMSMKNGGLLSFFLNLEEGKIKKYMKYVYTINILLASLCLLFAYFETVSSKKILFSIFFFPILFSHFGLKVRIIWGRSCSYKELGALEMKIVLVQYTTLMISLFLGLGVYSLALQYLAILVVEFFVYIKERQRWKLLERKEVVNWGEKLSIGVLKWPLANELFMGVALQGDYVALSYNVSAYILGMYYFAFQLTSSVAQLLTQSIRNILVPALIANKADMKNFWQEYNNYACVLNSLSLIICSSGIVLSELALVAIWKDKWLSVHEVINILLLALSLRLQMPLIYSVLEALSRWKLRFLILSTDGIMLILTAFFLGLNGELSVIAIGIGIYRILSVALLLFLFRTFCEEFEFSNILFVKLFISNSLLFLVFYVVNTHFPPINDLANYLIYSVGLIMVASAFSVFMEKKFYLNLLARISNGTRFAR